MGLLSVGRRAGVVCVFKKRTAVRFGLTPSLPSMASSTAAVPVLAEHDDARPCVRVSTLPSPPRTSHRWTAGRPRASFTPSPPCRSGGELHGRWDVVELAAPVRRSLPSAPMLNLYIVQLVEQFSSSQNVSPLPSKSALHAKSSDSNLAPNLSNSVECIPAWLRLKGFPML